MGWIYEHRLAYGITVNSWDNPGLEDLLNNLQEYLDYDSKMSLEGPGTLFIYFRSSYKVILKDAGMYSSKLPDTEGDDFYPPKHRIIHKIDNDLLSPKHSIEEYLALRKIRIFCKTRKFGTWMRHSYILHC